MKLSQEQLQEIERAISEIPGDEGWWHESNGISFQRSAIRMVKHGFTVSEAIDLLSGLYGAVADEFGS